MRRRQRHEHSATSTIRDTLAQDGALHVSVDITYTPLSRTEYLAQQAMRYTLLNALDVNGFRAYLGIKKKHVGDEDLLRQMHEERAESPYLPETAQAVSQRWLNENVPLVRRRLGKKRSRG